MSVEGGTNPRSGAAAKRPVRAPLNSRRMTADCLKRIGSAIDLPTAASTVELLQMIDAKLTDQGHDSQNVQVVLEDGTPKSRISLQDEKGEFLVIEPEEEGETDNQQSNGHGSVRNDHRESEGAEGEEALRTAL